MNRVCRLALFEKSTECSLVGSVGKFYTESGGNGLDAIPASRGLYDAADGERTLLLQELSHGDISGNHETFDNIFGDVMFTDGEVLDFALFNEIGRAHV